MLGEIYLSVYKHAARRERRFEDEAGKRASAVENPFDMFAMCSYTYKLT